MSMSIPPTDVHLRTVLKKSFNVTLEEAQGMMADTATI